MQTTRRRYIHLQDDPKVREALERLQGTLAAPQTPARAAAAGGG
ncbi:MAG TPA: hypothetical protein VN193_06565 [Candidatus Angelobacter sp.]|nr:hypothetical protein [Candidatus Angelobacter sp.]